MEVINSNFFKSPNKIFDLNITSSEILVLGYLLSLSRNDSIFPSKKTISQKTKLSKRTVDRAVARLVSRGYLEYNRGFNKNNTYICNQYRVILKNIDSKCINKNNDLHKIKALESKEFNEMVKQLVRNGN